MFVPVNGDPGDFHFPRMELGQVIRVGGLATHFVPVGAAVALAAALPGDVADEEVQNCQASGVVGAIGVLHGATVEVGHRLAAHGGKVRGGPLNDRGLDSADGGVLLHGALTDPFLEHGVNAFHRNAIDRAGVFQVRARQRPVVMGGAVFPDHEALSVPSPVDLGVGSGDGEGRTCGCPGAPGKRHCSR